MRYQSRKLTEWDLNETLDAIFMARYLDQYMLIFKDGDMHAFADHEKKRLKANNRQVLDGPLEPQSFRPDAIALDKQGQSYILETKIGHRVSSAAEHTQLVVQTLVYSNLFISPAWPGKQPWGTYPFLNYLHKAYWHRHRRDFGEFIELKDEHCLHFRLPKPLLESDFKTIPQVIFLLEHFSEERLRSACLAIRGKDFAEFENYALQQLPTNSRYKKRLGEMKNNWGKLREIEFHRMNVDFSLLKSILGERVPIG